MIIAARHTRATSAYADDDDDNGDNSENTFLSAKLNDPNTNTILKPSPFLTVVESVDEQSRPTHANRALVQLVPVVRLGIAV